MKKEIVKLWNDYLVDCSKKESEYFQHVVNQFGPTMYSPNKANKPSFEGFMTYLSTPRTDDK